MKRQPIWGQAKWRHSIWLLLAPCLLVALLAGCANKQMPSYYVWTDAEHLVTLTWQNPNDSLSGEYISISYASVSFPTVTAPDVVTVAYTGSESGNTVTLDIGGEHIIGALDPDASQLSVAFVDPASGQAVHQTWVAVTAEEQAQLVAAFSAYEQVRGWLGVAERDAAGENAWNAPNTASLAQMRQSMSEQQAELTAMQNTLQITMRCHLIARFAPIASSAFTLPATAAQDGTLHNAAMLIQAWKSAQRQRVPHVAGLALPWIISPPIEEHESEQFAAFANRLQIAYRQDKATMQRLRQQDEQIAQQVTILGQDCPPIPA